MKYGIGEVVVGITLISALIVLGAVIAVFFIQSKWRYYAQDPLGLMLYALRSANELSRVWPTDDGFNSLKFSVARHMVISLASVAVMYFFSDSFAARIVPAVNLLYAMSKIPLYLARKRDWKVCGGPTRELLTPVKKACFATVIYGFYVYCLSLVFYGIRP